MSSTPGWYPDPGGDRRLLRYWDGTRWSSQTRPAPPGVAPAPPVRRSGPGRLLVPVIIAIVVVAVIAVVTTVATQGGPRDITDNPPSYTISAGNDGEPTESPRPSPSDSSDGSSSPTSTQRSSAPVDRQACEQPRENRLPSSPDGPRVSAGALSFPKDALPGWQGPVAETRTPYGRDTSAMLRRIDTETAMGWQSSVNVGVLDMPDFPGAEQAAGRLLDCITTSAFYTSVDVEVTSRQARAVDIAGRPAVRLDAVITFDHPDLQTKGSRLWIVIVDTGRAEPDRYGFCFAATPVENTEHQASVEAALAGLRVD